VLLSTAEIAEMTGDTLDLREFLTALEKALIERALKATSGSQAEAARRLGLSRSDVSYKLSKHSIRGTM
jgi:transcriptional regulator with GAF, ATPase, and Fis domain